jgi:hypothetical protein
MEGIPLYDVRLGIFEERCNKFKDLPLQLKLIEYGLLVELASLLKESIPFSVRAEYEGAVCLVIDVINSVKEICNLVSDLREAIYDHDIDRMKDLIGALLVCVDEIKSKLEK